MTVAQAAEKVFLEEYGRVFASLVGYFRDFSVAEEAIQDAFVVAIGRWPTEGLPENPAAWITTTAKRKARDDRRRERVWGPEVRCSVQPRRYRGRRVRDD